MQQGITQSESAAISYLRVLAMLSIVACHFLQSLGSHWAWVFNIGVQVFLLMSGYLYGHKQIGNWREWFGKRFVRIYIPYLLFIVAIIPVYAVARMLSIKNIFVYLLDIQGVFGGGVKGLGHLWFMTAIVLCYAITPLLQWSRRWAKGLIWLVVLLAAVVILYLPVQRSIASWFVLYALGYYLAIVDRKAKWTLGILTVFVFVWLLSRFDWSALMQMSSAYSMSFHMAGAVIVFLTGLLVARLIGQVSVPKVIRTLDRYSFQIYIVHHVLVMPPFGMLHVTGYLAVNILIALFYIAFFTWVLATMEERLKMSLSQKLDFLN